MISNVYTYEVLRIGAEVGFSAHMLHTEWRLSIAFRVTGVRPDGIVLQAFSYVVVFRTNPFNPPPEYTENYQPPFTEQELIDVATTQLRKMYANNQPTIEVL